MTVSYGMSHLTRTVVVTTVSVLVAATEASTQAQSPTSPPTREAPETVEPSTQRTCPDVPLPGTWAIKGVLLTPDKVIPRGEITLAGEKIASVNAVDPGSPKPCAIEIDGIILPGLIDLHNHLAWNILPRWRPSKTFSNRHEWRISQEYEERLKMPQDSVAYDPPKLGCEANLYAEVKALAGGATAAAGSFSVPEDYPDATKNTCISGLVRNLDYKSGFPKQLPRAGQQACSIYNLGEPITDVAVNLVFPLGRPPDPILPETRLDTPWESAKKNDLKQELSYLACHLKNGTLRSMLIHLAEGTDATSQDEFTQIQVLGLLMPGLVIIHGTALNAGNFAAMKDSGTGLVWSPRSNVELYGATANIPAAKRAGVAIAIAPDWSPTGSAGMLQELKYASTKYDYFSAAQLTAMATSNPAKIARIDHRIGRLEAGLYADLLVLRSRRGKAYDAVVNATPAAVRLVVIGGRPVYGDSDLLRKLLPNKQLQQLTVCGITKAIDLSGTVAASSSWDAVKSHLESQLNKKGSTLGPFECGNEVNLPIIDIPHVIPKPEIIPGPGPVEDKSN